MEYQADRWVQRLRDGVPPPRWAAAVAVTVLVGVGTGALVLEGFHLDWLTHLRRPASFVLLPLVMLGWGLWIAFGARSNGRRDRRTLARIRAHGPVAFHLPVEPVGEPAPVVWTVDATGLHAWGPDHADPFADVAWTDVERIDLLRDQRKGQWIDVAVRITRTDGSSLALLPRTALGRPYQAGQVKLDVLMRVLRSLRRELAR